MTAKNQEAPRFTGVASFFRAPLVPNHDDWSDIDIGIVGVPFDGGTTNRPGARLGPRAVRDQSSMIAPWNQSTDVNPFKRLKVADIGDAWAEEPFDLEPALDQITRCFEAIRDSGVTPLAVGGDHSVSLPILRALGRSKPVGLIHIDAHCDTGDGYMGSKFHHGAPFARAVEEGVLDPKRTIQIGIRGPLNSSEVWKLSREYGMRVIMMDEVIDRGLRSVISEARDVVGEEECYLSFDIDSLDPAFAPGTGTPVAGGFTSREAIQLVRGMSGVNLIGADVVEVSPLLDVQNTTSLVAATILFEILCLLSQHNGSR